MAENDGLQQVGVEYVSKFYEQFMSNLRSSERGFQGFKDSVVDSIGAIASSVPGVGGALAELWKGIVKLDEGLQKLTPQYWTLKALGAGFKFITSGLSELIGNVWSAINPFAFLRDAIRRIFYISAGVLVADLFRGMVRGIRDMAQEAFQAASDFQLLKIRMEGLMARDIVNGVDELGRSAENFDDALKQVSGDVRDVFEWITKLAVRTPFTIEDITNTFTLAKAYGMTTTMTKRLIMATGNFAAGMGLTGEHIQRIIENLGQMIQQGKITGTEMRDLARGSFVPVNEVLEEMAKKYGVTSAEMRQMAKDGKVDVMDFIEGFMTVAERDFPNGMDRMAQTFATVISNVQDFVQAILGFKVLGGPVDVLAKKLSGLLEAFVGDPRVGEFAQFLGGRLRDMIDGIFPALSDPQKIADAVFSWVDVFRSALEESQMGTTLFDQLGFETWEEKAAKLGVPQHVIDSINNLKVSWENIRIWWAENKDVIIGYINQVLGAFGVNLPTDTDITGGLLEFTEYMRTHGDEINEKIRKFVDPLTHFLEITVPLYLSGGHNENIISKTVPLNTLDQTIIRIGVFFDWLGKVHEKMMRIRDMIIFITGPIRFLGQSVWATIQRVASALLTTFERIASLVAFISGSSIPSATGSGGGNSGRNNNVTNPVNGPPTQGGTVNYNVLVNANYQNQQSSSNVALDVRAALAAIS